MWLVVISRTGVSRLDTLPATQSTASKHWRQLQAVTPCNVKSPSCSVDPMLDSSWKEQSFIYDSILMPLPHRHYYWLTAICTQDNDHAGDEKFRGCWPSHLEQFTSHSVNCNSLPSDVRSTSEGPPVWLIGSASEDYLWCALQIHSSSLSSLYRTICVSRHPS